MARLFMLKARMSTSIILMFVVLFAFIFALSILVLFLFTEIPMFFADSSSEFFDYLSEYIYVDWESIDPTLLQFFLQYYVGYFFVTLQIQASLFNSFMLSQSYGPMLIGVSIFTLIFVMFQWGIGPAVVRRSLGLQYIGKGGNPWLEKTVDNLAKKSGLPTPKIAIWNTEQPNACVFGRTAGGATLAVSKGLLKTLNKNEVEAVIGHEIGHLKHKDYLVMTCLAAIPIMCYMIAMFAFYGSRGSRRGKSFAILIIIAILAFIVYIATLIVVRTLSRQREFYSDAYSAYVTENPRGLKSALTKIAYGLSLNPAETHGARAFFIEDPANAVDQVRRIVDRKYEYDIDKDGTLDEKELEKAMEIEAKRTKWNGLNNLFSTHPPTYKRILLLSVIDREMSSAKYSTKNIYKNV
ncbi:MAG: M48 family metalloprotease [Candidatus Jordarchaeum sp.]|uniref:M48 family metalloprotease n=1 Tax=Candidatus Jordarchaeum sp. TaxID=2823881 RepID=UPI004049CD26